ncbi:hypothetical protein [Microbacterium aurantiacum]|uniref:hypothetical protein n=1 Tax=Microbacterium aurantiacum TaxID=162393 RepID=UPI0012E115F4|nr:hypothetical protein [Microbacterium chocolatum]
MPEPVLEETSEEVVDEEAAEGPTPEPVVETTDFAGVSTRSGGGSDGYAFTYEVSVLDIHPDTVFAEPAYEVGKTKTDTFTQADVTIENITPGDRPYDVFAFTHQLVLFAIYPADSIVCADSTIYGQGCIVGYAPIDYAALGATKMPTSDRYQLPGGVPLSTNVSLTLTAVSTDAEAEAMAQAIREPSGFGLGMTKTSAGTPVKYVEPGCTIDGIQTYEFDVLAQSGAVSVCG